MTAFVLDRSVAAAWLIEDEASAETDAPPRRPANGGGAAPGRRRLEVGDVPGQAERRRRVAAAKIAPPARLVELLPIEVDPETGERALGTILSLAREETPATCDAACLELAMRRGMELATLDGEPRRTARRARVAVPPR